LYLSSAKTGFLSTYTTVGTVSTSALLGGLVDLDVLDDEVGGVETLGVSVGLGVLEETEQELGGLGGPASAGDTELLACRRDSVSKYSTMCASVVPPLSAPPLPLHCRKKDMFRALTCFPKSPNAHSQVVPWAVRPVEPA
jgi:hypothetical protein